MLDMIISRVMDLTRKQRMNSARLQEWEGVNLARLDEPRQT